MRDRPQRHAWKRLKGAVSSTTGKRFERLEETFAPRQGLDPQLGQRREPGGRQEGAEGSAKQLETSRPCARPAGIPVRSPRPRPKHSGLCLGASSPLGVRAASQSGRVPLQPERASSKPPSPILP